jgi:hypothetical protein
LLVWTSGCNASPSGVGAQAAVQTSPWSSGDRGLQARADIPAEIEQNAIVSTSVELRSDPHSLSARIDRFDRFLAADHLQLRLKEVATGKSFQIDAYGDPSAGMALPDRGRDCVLLSPSPFQRISAEFPLRAAGSLKPGNYECTINYSTSRNPGFGESRRCRAFGPAKLKRSRYRSR